MRQWDGCPVEWEAAGLLPAEPGSPVRGLPHRLLHRFVDRPCFVGIDLSLTTDMSAVTAVFPRSDGFDVLPFCYMPSGRLRHRELRDGVPYGMWAEQGFLELHDGDVID